MAAPSDTHEKVVIDKYKYIRLIANHRPDKNGEDVTVIVDVGGLKSEDCEELSVAVTLDPCFYEVLIFEKDKKGKVINRYVCAEDTPEYSTGAHPITRKGDAVLLNLKRKGEPWTDNCTQAYRS